MYELKIKATNKGIKLSLQEIIEQFNQAPHGKPLLITFYPVGQLPLPLILELIPHIPEQCEGLDLVSLMGSSKPINEIEVVCALLPKHLKLLKADIMLPEEPSEEHISRFIKALPKTEYLSLTGNDLYRASATHIAMLHNVRILDLRGNKWHRSWPGGSFELLKSLTDKTTTLYIDLYPLNNLTNLLSMRQNFFANLPPHIHTLGLNMFDFNQSAATLSAMNPTVTTLKWFKHWKISLPTTCIEFTPASVHTLDLSEWELSRCPPEHVSEMLSKVPKHVTTLILNQNEFYKWSQEDFVSFIRSIPDTVTCVHLKGNELFTHKTLAEQEALLQALQSYNQNGRLILEDNDCAPSLLAELPLISTIQPQLSNENIRRLNPIHSNTQTPGFFKGAKAQDESLLNNILQFNQ